MKSILLADIPAAERVFARMVENSMLDGQQPPVVLVNDVPPVVRADLPDLTDEDRAALEKAQVKRARKVLKKLAQLSHD